MRATSICRIVVRDLDDDGRLLWIPDDKTTAGRRTLKVPAVLRTLLKRQAKGRARGLYLFGDGATRHNRKWVWRWVQRVCDGAGVPRVSAHGQRGFHATLRAVTGGNADQLARDLGHVSFDGITARHYVQTGAMDEASLGKVADLLVGQRRGPKRAAADALAHGRNPMKIRRQS